MTEIITSIIAMIGAGGGLYSVIQNRKYQSECKKQEIENSGAAIEMWRRDFYEPLRKEFNEIKKVCRALQDAISKVNDCEHSNDCPVRRELRKQKDRETDGRKDGD